MFSSDTALAAQAWTCRELHLPVPVPLEGQGHGASWSSPQRAAKTPGTCTTLGHNGEGGMTWQDLGLFFWQVSDALTQKTQSGTCSPREALNRHTQTAKHRGRSWESHADGFCNNAF